MTSSIPTYYRIFFTFIDPVLSSFGVIIHLQSAKVLHNYSLNPVIPPVTETRLVLDALVGFFAGLAFLQAALLRARPDDVVIWKCLQAATVLVDVGMVSGFVRALGSTGRLDTRKWRPQQWSNVGINSFVGIVRILFVLGVGLPKVKTA